MFTVNIQVASLICTHLIKAHSNNMGIISLNLCMFLIKEKILLIKGKQTDTHYLDYIQRVVEPHCLAKT